jgi:hypothetical protein
MQNRKEQSMSNQPENGVLTPRELRQTLLNELEISQQAITALSDEQLEEIAGGRGAPGSHHGWGKFALGAAVGTFFGPSILGAVFGGGSQSSQSSQGYQGGQGGQGYQGGQGGQGYPQQ